MKRLHVHVSVDDLTKSIQFYSTLFAAEPTVTKDDYAKWMLEDPRINFAISQRGGKVGINHLGFQVDSDAELEAFLEESLPADQMAAIESEIRQRPEMLRRLSMINGRRDAGLHSVGEIWRRHRLSCPDRQQLGSYLLGVLDNDHSNYIRFHLDEIGCPYCQANLDDLRKLQGGK